MNTSTQLVKGALLENTVSFLRDNKGEEDVTKLEAKLGSLLFDEFHMYPLDQYQTLQNEVVELVSPNDLNAGYKDLGKHAFKTFTSSIVGATLTNVSRTPKKLLEQIQELWNMVVNFGQRKLIECDETKKTATIEIVDDPRNPAFLEGVIEASLQSIGISANTEVQNQSENRYIIQVTW